MCRIPAQKRAGGAGTGHDTIQRPGLDSGVQNILQTGPQCHGRRLQIVGQMRGDLFRVTSEQGARQRINRPSTRQFGVGFPKFIQRGEHCGCGKSLRTHRQYPVVLPRGGQWFQLLTASCSQHRATMQGEGHIGTQLRRDLLQLRIIQPVQHRHDA